MITFWCVFFIVIHVLRRMFTSKPVERITFDWNCEWWWLWCCKGEVEGVGYCDFTATGRYSVAGVDAFDTHALVRHPNSFVLLGHLGPFFGKYNDQYRRFGHGTISIDCDPIEMFAVNVHLHGANRTMRNGSEWKTIKSLKFKSFG